MPRLEPVDRQVSMSMAQELGQRDGVDYPTDDQDD